MRISNASLADLDEAVGCMAAAFAEDPITGFLLQTGPGYHERVSRFFSLLMRARIALGMPALVARNGAGVEGAAMGYATTHPDWPPALAEEWGRFEKAIPGMTERMAVYEGIAAAGKPSDPHYYLGVIATDPALRGRGIGMSVLKSFCDLSARDPRSKGVYLETAQPSNVGFYQRAGFVETTRGMLGSSTLWCMYLPHDRPAA